MNGQRTDFFTQPLLLFAVILTLSVAERGRISVLLRVITPTENNRKNPCQAPKTQITPSILHIRVAYQLPAASYTRDRTSGKPRATGAFHIRKGGIRHNPFDWKYLAISHLE